MRQEIVLDSDHDPSGDALGDYASTDNASRDHAPNYCALDEYASSHTQISRL